TPEAAAKIASMIGVLFQQTQRRRIAEISPLDTALLEIFTQRLDGPEKLSLLNRERANREIDRRPFLPKQKCFQKRRRVLAARKRDSHAVAIANHFEAMDSLPNLPQKCFFQLHCFDCTEPRPLGSGLSLTPTPSSDRVRGNYDRLLPPGPHRNGPG